MTVGVLSLKRMWRASKKRPLAAAASDLRFRHAELLFGKRLISAVSTEIFH